MPANFEASAIRLYESLPACVYPHQVSLLPSLLLLDNSLQVNIVTLQHARAGAAG
jgi:hypothetical protein